ncbi:polyketide synthase, partial [Mesorhizobium sp. M0772]|uniref:beta-ketoacyl [acyl carrier protein] synthase domain-containing protein n=1 Tax=Mesorhizobium sp. M0772 TaxID=2956998 RepID=UPI00333BC11D
MEGLIGIVGIGVRMPGGVASPDEFWQALRQGYCAIGSVGDRFPTLPARVSVPQVAGLLESIADFDADFFKVSPREARHMDPQHRMLLEVGWEALEDAGYAAHIPARTGVYVGMMNQHEYEKLQLDVLGPNCTLEPYYGTGGSSNIAAGRLSTFLDVRGPCMTIDTACSSSLVCAHLACSNLRAGEVDMALVGGVHALITSELLVNGARLGMISKNGRCAPFQSHACGMVIGEGCAFVVLKRVEDALADGDTVYATLVSSAVNHDGAPHQLLRPNPAAQRQVIEEALVAARREPDEIDYVEAHGTGTVLGDSSELDALGLFDVPSRNNPLAVGSVKANIGHLIGAAGLAGLVKTALCLHHKEYVQQPIGASGSPHQLLEAAGARIATATPWPRSERPRLAGVNSFGWGGTNVHVVVEECPEQCEAGEVDGATGEWHLL